MSTKTTYKQTELGLIPEDWEVKKIGDICGIYIGKDVKKDCFSYKRTPDFKFPVFSNTVDNNGLYGFYNFEEYKQHNALTVVGRGIGLGTAFVRNNSFGAIGRLIVLYPNELTSNGYLTYYINSKVKFYTESSGIPQLTGEQICKYKICVPPLPEQKKIADCLSTWDVAIEKQSALINALTDRKKALMQQLLTGKKRLPGFSDEWKEVKLGSLCKVTTGKLDANAMVENGIYRFYTCAKDYYLINEYKFDTEALLISGNGANVGYIHYYKGKFNAYQRTYVLDKFKEDIFFIKYFLDYFLSQRISNEKKEGNTPYIVLSTLTEMSIKLPTLSEQTAIAEILATADRELQLQKDKLAQLQQQKKGLMQVLLTGKKRLIN